MFLSLSAPVCSVVSLLHNQNQSMVYPTLVIFAYSPPTAVSVSWPCILKRMAFTKPSKIHIQPFLSLSRRTAALQPDCWHTTGAIPSLYSAADWAPFLFLLYAPHSPFPLHLGTASPFCTDTGCSCGLRRLRLLVCSFASVSVVCSYSMYVAHLKTLWSRVFFLNIKLNGLDHCVSSSRRSAAVGSGVSFWIHWKITEIFLACYFLLFSPSPI